MGIDIRLPIGLMFSAFGILLIAFGALGNKAIYERSLGINVNLAWGIVLLVFGAVMLVFGRPRSGAKRQQADTESGAKSAEHEVNTRSRA